MDIRITISVELANSPYEIYATMLGEADYNEWLDSEYSKYLDEQEEIWLAKHGMLE